MTNNMRESEETYYGETDMEEVKLNLAAERRTQKGIAETYFEKTQDASFNQALTAKHILVIGGTGAGKTYWVTKLCERLNCFVFVNTQVEVEVENVCQVVTFTPEDLLEIIGEGYTKIEFIPSEDIDEAMEQLREIRRILFNLGEVMYPKRPPEEPTINFIIDEAQLYMPKMSRTDLDNIATRGRRWGVRGIFLTQRPQLLSSTAINLCEQQVIFLTGQYESKYFSGYKIPIEIHKEWLLKPYHFVMYDGRDITRYLPVK